MTDLSWNWILWILAAGLAVGSLVRLSIMLRDRLQAKLDEYYKQQLNELVAKRRHLSDMQRRAEIAKKLLDDRKALDAEAKGSS